MKKTITAIIITVLASMSVVAPASALEIKLHDLNSDDIVNVADVSYLQTCLASPVGIPAYVLQWGDFNGDDVVDITDATFLQLGLAE